MTTLITANEEIKDIKKIFKYLERCYQNNLKLRKRTKSWIFFSISLAILAASLLWNWWTGKEVVQASEGTVREKQGF